MAFDPKLGQLFLFDADELRANNEKVSIVCQCFGRATRARGNQWDPGKNVQFR